jgi:hypothetical protein
MITRAAAFAAAAAAAAVAAALPGRASQLHLEEPMLEGAIVRRTAQQQLQIAGLHRFECLSEERRQLGGERMRSEHRER